MADSQPTAGADAPQPVVEYRGVPGFPGYRVGSDGTVWSRWGRKKKNQDRSGWAQIFPWPNPQSGHLYIGLRRAEDRRKIDQVHRLVLAAFCGPAPPKHECRHLDGNPRNNNLSNLAWGTRQENVNDKFVHGTVSRGELRPLSKLTRKDVIIIRELRARHPGWSGIIKFIRDWFAISYTTASAVANKKEWKWLSDDGSEQ